MTKDDFWRKYFAVYDVLNELRPYQDLLGSVKDNLKIKKGDLVLDAGAGTGSKGGQVPFLGLPVGRTVVSSPNFLIIFIAHASAPNGFPFTTDPLMSSSSSLV